MSFIDTDGTPCTDAKWIANVKSQNRVVVATSMTLDGTPMEVWAFYAGHPKKIYKCVVQTIHKNYAGTLSYHDTAAEAQAKHDALVAEIEAKGGKKDG